MKKVSTKAARQSRNFAAEKLTVGLDPRVQPTDRSLGRAELSGSGATQGGEGNGHADRVDPLAALEDPHRFCNTQKGRPGVNKSNLN